MFEARRRGVKPTAKVRVKAGSSAAAGAEAEKRDEAALLKAKLAALRADNARLYRRIDALNDLRASVAGLTAEPLEPQRMHGSDIGEGGGRTVVLHLSDVHMDENIDLEQMDGLNSFSRSVCAARVTRFFEKSAALMTKYWHGAPPERIALLLGGDMISGDIHEELAKTNDFGVLSSIRAVAEVIAAGVDHLLESVPGAALDIYTVDGNHGRLTRKPEAKNSAMNSTDIMVSHLVEMRVAPRDDVSFYYAASPDCLFDIYGRNVLLTHGDKIGSRGGTGFIGPVANIIKGFARVQQNYMDRGVPLYKIHCGHFHTTSVTPQGFSNGSIPGPSEYGQAGRFRFEPPQQTYVVHHADKGVIETRNILVGARSRTP